MAVVEENWQTKRQTIKERTKFMFNNELLSDVKFVVPASTGGSESKKVIPAHKFVLAISSPVFFAMLCGQMAETTDSIELPDCEYESLLELFRFLYSDEVNLSGSNVMQVLYLAKKYMVPSLAAICTKYLRDNLDASNVFCILPHAQKFDDKDLEDRCWKVIKMQTEEAVTSDEFVTLERSLVEAVVKREALRVKEVELFKAVDRWATRESERQGMTPDGHVKRRILGEEIVKAIRFPLMSETEFVSVVFDSCILTVQELGDMMKYYNGILTSPSSFIQIARIDRASVQRCHRFKKTNWPDCSTGWNYSILKIDGLCFTANKPIKLHGVQHFGSEGGKYTVVAELKDVTDDSSVVKQSGSYTSVKCEADTFYSFDVLFDNPVCLVEGRMYELLALINGSRSWHGAQGKKSVECEGVEFTFNASINSSNLTGITCGQFPALLFSKL